LDGKSLSIFISSSRMRKAMDWREGFAQLPLDKENKFKEGS
jgi:hypothetical protein